MDFEAGIRRKAPYSKWYHVNPLLKKEVFTMESQVFHKNPVKRIFGVGADLGFSELDISNIRLEAQSEWIDFEGRNATNATG